MSLHPTFLGLSVMDFKSSAGWGSEQTSELRVMLVQDHDAGDMPSAPPVGSPIYFQFFNFKFFGLLQKFTKRNSQQGMPTWEAICHDPRDILRGTQLIIGNYNGNVADTRNLINPFGWWENNFGFGSSLANDSGMPWNLIQSALLNICNTPAYGLFGGPLSYRGFQYSLDLSQLPVPDISYRIGGGSICLMDAISQLCEDGGCDFFVELAGFTIRIRTVSRRNQPPLGTIAQVTNTNWGNVLRSEDGVEARNEITSAFLTGGPVCELFQTDLTGLSSFWGYDLAGKPILGEPGVLNFFGKAPPNGVAPLIGSFPCEFMNLNATGIADIVGSVIYRCSTLEMRLAMVSYDSWATFIENHRPEIKPFIYSPFKDRGGQGLAEVKPNIVKDDKVAALNVSMAGINSDFHQKAQRLYEFVKSYGTDFYGKKFLVGLPFILTRQDPDTLRVSYTQEPTDGGWLPEDATPLGLSWLNQDVFKNGDGRFRSFIGLSGMTGVDLSRVSPGDSVIENDTLYLRASVEPNVVFLPLTGQPAALLSLGSAIYKEAVDGFGDTSIITAVLGKQPGEAKKVLDGRFGSVGVKIWPEARYPQAVAIPLKSNIMTYGPWYVSGAPGKIRYEQDPSMTPWTYGGWDEMNQAGNARILNAVTNMQVSEAGTLEVAGSPAVSLGDVLQTGGPNVTNIDVSYGREGITTSYRFQTYTPRFGVFSKQLAERIKRLGLTGQELRKAVRAGINQQIGVQETVVNAVRGFLANAPKAINRQTPHEVLISHGVEELPSPSGGPNVRVCPKTLTYEEAVGLAMADDDSEYQKMACMSMDGLIRPFTTQPGTGSLMPGFVTPSSTQGMNAGVLNPFKAGNDIAYLASGYSYERLHTYEVGNEEDNTRGLCLRGPLVVAGWGFDTDCLPVPGDGSGEWLTNVLRRSDQWKCGPVDLLWDERRGVWTSHDLLFGAVMGNLPAGGSGLFEVAGYGTGWHLMVHNPWSAAVSGVNGMVGYVAPLNKWYIVAADCVP